MEEEEEAKPEKTIFNVVLASVNDLTKNKLKVIKAIRAMKPEDSLVQVGGDYDVGEWEKWY